jgi:hypothetical protein
MSLGVQITFDAHDPPALADFWAAVLDYHVPGPPGVDLEAGADPWPAWDEFLQVIGVPEELRRSKAAIEDPQGRGPRLFFQRVPEAKVAKNRGATRVRRFEPAPPVESGFIVMQDPEGNEFCLD